MDQSIRVSNEFDGDSTAGRSASAVYAGLSDLERSLFGAYLKSPNTTRVELAKRFDVHPATVGKFFRSKEFGLLSESVAKSELKALILPAIAVFQKALDSSDIRVAYKAARDILNDVGVIVEGSGKAASQDNRIQIMWGAAGQTPPPQVKIESPAQGQASA